MIKISHNLHNPPHTHSNTPPHLAAPPKIKLPPQYEQGLIFDTDELIRLRIPYTGRPQPQASWTHNGKQVPDVFVFRGPSKWGEIGIFLYDVLPFGVMFVP